MNQADDSDRDNDGGSTEGAVVGGEKPMGFFDHLEALRRTLIKCVVVYAVFAAGLAYFLKDFQNMLLWPLDIARKAYPHLAFDLGTWGVTEVFSVVINLCGLGALLPSAPFFFFFVAQFIAPALRPQEKRMVVPVCIASFLLFVAGSALGFFVMAPSMLKFSAHLNEMFGFTMRWTPGSYYGTMSWLVIGAGLLFQAPLVVLLLVHLGFLRVRTLSKYRRHTIVAILIVVALVSPTPDPVTQAFFAVPLYLLFELSIILGRRVEKKRALRAAAEGWDADMEEDADDGKG